MGPEWSDFKVLLALARGGSIAAAARELQVDNSTISRRLAALEDAVGAKLLIRGGREFGLTAEGRVLHQAAGTMETTAIAALRAVRAAKVDLDGSVSVSVAPAFVPILMRSMLPALRQAHPALGVELRGAVQRADLAKGSVDIAVRMMRPDEPDLVACRAFDCGWFVYAAPAYLDTHGRPERYEDLALHDLVLYAESMHNAPPLRWMETYKGAAHAASRMDSLETASQVACAGGGITVLPGFLGDPIGELQRVFPDRVAVNTGWVVYHEGLRDSARVRAVADALLAFFRSHEAMFSGLAPR